MSSLKYQGSFFWPKKLLTRPQPKLGCVVWLVCLIRIGQLQILILIWDCSWTNILSKKNWFPLLDAGAESRKFSPNARGPGDRNPSLFHPETSEKCSNCHTEGFFFAIDRWKREKSWRLHKISPFDVILKEKEQLLHFNRRLVQFEESWRRNNFVLQKTIGLWEYFRTIGFFVWSDQNVDWWRDRDFFRPNDLILRPRLF